MSTNTEKNICDTLAPVAVTIAAVAAKEIESLKQSLQEKDTLLLEMEATCLTDSERQAELEDSVIAWQDKYDRLYESHKRVQKVNQSLEDKLLKLVDRNTGERAQLTSDVATLSVRLAQANFNISKLQRDIERYKTDINLAIQLLHCKPEGFVPQKISSLPIDIQSKVSTYMRLDTNSHSDSEGSVTGIGISTTAAYKVLPATDSPPPAPCPFPPTAMVYSMRGLDAKQNSESTLNLSNNSNNNNNSTSDTLNNNKNSNNNNNSNNTIRNSTTSLNTTTANTNCALNGNDMISPVVMAKFLEDELKAGEMKHCDTCQCSKDLTVLADVSRSYSVATQTPFVVNANGSNGNLNDSMAQLCLRCYSNLNSPSRTNSPFTKNLLKSSDSVISETKSSVSDLNDMDKLFTPAKKDDLMVNPILGHHRLCERTSLLKGVNGQAGAAKTSYNTILDNMRSLNGYQRRFIDGGGTALELLEERSKLLNPKQHSLKLSNHEDINGNDEIEDEEKPLLVSNLIHSNLLDNEMEERDSLKVKSKLRAESSCELGVARDHIKSPTASTKSAVDTKLTNSLLKTQISGSVNSVWSKTSSCEGAKMFENFNRNLIKTIKAENPKYRGPRLCAMRIQQNGQSNILLDNIESIEALTPVIYRRRERLLDEELDDGKNIITSKTTMESNVTIETAKEAIETETATEDLKPLEVAIIKKETETECPKLLADSNTNEETILVCGDEKTDNLLEIKMEPVVKPCLQTTTTTNYDNTSKMSGTQSSSISENIDFQETVILRRQQLSRVAEWVQNNTQQMEMEQQQQQQQQHLSTLNNCDSSGTDHQSSFSTLDQLDSVSVEKLSVDSGYKTTPQLQPITNSSQDETIKTSDDSLSPKSDLNNQSPLNFPQNPLQMSSNSNTDSPKQEQTDNTQLYSTPQTYYRRTSRSGLPVAYIAAQDCQDSSSQCSQIIPEQPTCDILNYKYYPNDSDKTRAIKAELHTTTQNVDIAQMEYNVKQFLLKQNEWSMRTTRSQQPITNSNQMTTATAATSNRHATIRHIKLFSSSTAGIGPGKGERVRTTINQHNTSSVPSNITNAAAGSSTMAALGNCTKFNDLKVSSSTSNNNSSINNNHTITTTTTNGSMPQRTETNL